MSPTFYSALSTLMDIFLTSGSVILTVALLFREMQNNSISMRLVPIYRLTSIYLILLSLIEFILGAVSVVLILTNPYIYPNDEKTIMLIFVSLLSLFLFGIGVVVAYYIEKRFEPVPPFIHDDEIVR